MKGLMLKLMLQYFGHLTWRADSLEETLMLGKTEGRRRRGREYEMVGWQYQLNAHAFEQTQGESEGQGSLCATFHGVTKSQTQLSDWTRTSVNMAHSLPSEFCALIQGQDISLCGWSFMSMSLHTFLVQFSRSVVANSSRPHRLQHARPPVHHQLPEFTQIHVHWVGDAI